ncbi:MAG: tetratricopeptide repeat protein [Desulfovibrionaceae bacterium]
MAQGKIIAYGEWTVRHIWVRVLTTVVVLAALLWLLQAMGCARMAPVAGSQASARQAYAAGDYGRAAALYAASAAQGDAEACYQLGMMHARAQGVPHNAVLAEKYMAQAAEAGDTMAMVMLGYWHVSGIQVAAPDGAVGVRWLTRAAEAGDDVAQFLLGMAYRTGSGVAADPAQANVWLLKAAAQGVPVPELYVVQGAVQPLDAAAFAIN